LAKPELQAVAVQPSRATGGLGVAATEATELIATLSPLLHFNVILHKEQDAPLKTYLHCKEHPYPVHSANLASLALNTKARKDVLASVGQDVSFHCWSSTPRKIFWIKCMGVTTPRVVFNLFPSYFEKIVSSLPGCL